MNNQVSIKNIYAKKRERERERERYVTYCNLNQE